MPRETEKRSKGELLLERDLQEYLFVHPELILPDEVIIEKSREVCVEGRRIDLLLRTNAARYIVELKAVPLTREHIGQVAEYYGLMRGQIRDGNFKMILVARLSPTSERCCWKRSEFAAFRFRLGRPTQM